MALEFQIYDFIEDHENEEIEEDSDEGEYGDNMVYIIHTFGRTMDGKSVYMKIKNYTPYFYIKLPEKWSMSMAKTKMKRLYNYLSEGNLVWQSYAKHLIAIKVVEKMSPEGFTNGKKYLFGQLIFNNAKAMKSFRYKFETEKMKIYLDSKSPKEYYYNISEFDDKADKELGKTFMVDGEVRASTHKIKINEITRDNYVSCILENGYIAINMEKYNRFMKYEVNQMKYKFPNVNEKPFAYRTFEANLPPMLRCFHIRNIKGCGWVSVEKYYNVKKSLKETYCDIEINCDWRKINPIEKDTNAPFRICSYDIECFSHDGEFPQAKRKEDKIIQIGSTYTYVGQSAPYRQHIVCLGETADLDNIIVESYDTERDLVKGWIKEIKTSDCDIITGYNTHYFDDAYIYDRCNKILNLKNEILMLSKFRDKSFDFRDFKLASAALGENRIRMFSTPGRISIDLMKDVQKTYKLDSFKLDNVSATFIQGDIIKIEEQNDYYYDLYCKKINDIFVDDFIHIEQVFDFISDNIGKKYKIVSIDKENNILTIKGDEEIEEFLNEEQESDYKLMWSQAKDDVGPKDIFRLWKGTPEEKAIVAKYCIKDCRLVGLLINKLEVVTKNIEMSNVCSVPMSFLFTRGQLIKLFSFCLKVFREEGYVFPVQKASLEKLPSYEGAIVFDPEPNVEYDALAVKDYSSLYPSSIIHKNMSHETIVYDDRYDNLPGVEYFNSNFTEYDGSIQYRRFAKVNGELGIIPKVLQSLLGERKAVKKQMKKETDQFKKNILDAKQLALKVVANSLYGGTGADISQVKQRDIAACTTSTGREMLVFAKEYDENIVPWLIGGLKYAMNTDNDELFDYIIEKELKHKSDEFIENIKNYVSEEIKDYTFQPVIRYGDSIPSWEKVFVRYESKYGIQYEYFKMSELVHKFVNKEDRCNNKFKDFKGKYNYTSNTLLETYTDDGWTKIKYIIEHEYVGDFYTIFTTSGKITVTGDHSLILNDQTIIKPSELNIGNKLLTSDILNEEQVYIDCINNIDYYKYCILKDKFKNRAFDGTIYKIKKYTENEKSLVYDLETENHHFQAGEMNIIVHNTDSIFSSYRFQENNKSISKEKQMKIWKDIIVFSEKLISYFFPIEYKYMWEESHNSYYKLKNITDLRLPKSPVVKDKPTHHNVILDIEDRINIFLKEYMEGFYLPWIWTLQYVFNKETIPRKILKEILDVKLFRHGEELIRTMRIEPEDMDDNLKNKIYGDVDNFIKTKLKDTVIQPYWNLEDGNLINCVELKKGGKKITDKRTLDISLKMGQYTGELVKSRLPFPHDLEYEKTFFPFLILTKKRYVGNKYEFDNNKYKQDYNGIVLKRRDNAPIVKKVCGGIINCLINERDPEAARKYTIDCLDRMIEGKYNIKYFITSKTLKMKSSYADWTRIAHVVLADRIEKRNPGNSPQSGDRIEYIAVKVPGLRRDALQGERIETPQYIKDNNMKIDYEFYITNQIMKPALQFLELVIPDAAKLFDKYKETFKQERMDEDMKERGQVKLKLKKCKDTLGFIA
jgi:DNA polymerase elongation subunit (family B)